MGGFVGQGVEVVEGKVVICVCIKIVVIVSSVSSFAIDEAFGRAAEAVEADRFLGFASTESPLGGIACSRF